MMFKETVITAAVKKRELIVFFICFLGALILNVAGIILRHAPARELVTQLHVVLLMTLVLYGTTVILRVLYHLVSRFWLRK